MKKISLIGALLLSMSIVHAEQDIGSGSGGYEGSSGQQYQYDMSKPSDRRDYQYDYSAKSRDRDAIYNPGAIMDRAKDRAKGENGAGLYYE